MLREEGLQFKGGKWIDSGPYHCVSYSAPRKVTVEYTDLVDLLRQALGEGGIE